MPCEPAPSLSFPLLLGGRLLRKVSRLISLRSTCQVGLPWSRTWICATSTRDLCLEHAPFGGCYTPGASHNPMVLASCWEDWMAKVCDEHEGYMPQTPQMPTPIHQLPLLPQSRQAAPYQQQVQLPSKTSGLGVTFDSSASKPAPTDSQDTDVCGRQAT